MILSLSNDGPHPTLETVGEFTERDGTIVSGFVIDFESAVTVEAVRKEESGNLGASMRQEQPFDYLRNQFQEYNQGEPQEQNVTEVE